VPVLYSARPTHLTITSQTSPHFAEALGLWRGLWRGLGSGLQTAIDGPADLTGAVSPTVVWQTDRASALVQAVGMGLVAGLVGGLVAGGLVGLSVGLSVGPAIGLVAASFTAWYRFAIARVWLARQRLLPWSLMGFVHDAHRRGVLRQAGAVYQFRHARLQAHLADASPTSQTDR
jgi:hypothetical protein